MASAVEATPTPAIVAKSAVNKVAKRFALHLSDKKANKFSDGQFESFMLPLLSRFKYPTDIMRKVDMNKVTEMYPRAIKFVLRNLGNVKKYIGEITHDMANWTGEPLAAHELATQTWYKVVEPTAKMTHCLYLVGSCRAIQCPVCLKKQHRVDLYSRLSRPWQLRVVPFADGHRRITPFPMPMTRRTRRTQRTLRTLRTRRTRRAMALKMLRVHQRSRATWG